MVTMAEMYSKNHAVRYKLHVIASLMCIMQYYCSVHFVAKLTVMYGVLITLSGFVLR